MQKRQIVLACNEATKPDALQVNVTCMVNAQQIRRETYNGKPHFVVPSYTLPENVVMNDILYPAEEIDAHYKGLEGTLAPLGHPTLDGQFVSAMSAEGINAGHIGAFNRNVQKVGNRIYLEKWIDIEVANSTAKGKRVIERLEALERGDTTQPIHTSVAIFIERIAAASNAGYKWIAKFIQMDHDAILLDEPGAATPEQGVGLMVNADDAKALHVNTGALVGESYRDKERRLQAMAKKQFPGIEWLYVADFTDTHAVIVKDGATFMHAYNAEGFAIEGTEVKEQSFWTPVVNWAKKVFATAGASSTTPKEGQDMPITAEERAEVAKETAAMVANQMQTLLGPLADQIAALKTNQEALASKIDAPNVAKEADMRKAVAAVHGDIVANALQGEALAAMHSKLGVAAPAGGGIATNSGGAQPATMSQVDTFKV